MQDIIREELNGSFTQVLPTITTIRLTASLILCGPVRHRRV